MPRSLIGLGVADARPRATTSFSLQVVLDSVVAAFAHGHSPEAIEQQYPALSLEEVYGGILHYLAHADEVHGYMRIQDAVWKEWRERCDKAPTSLVDRLRALRRAGIKEAS